MAGRSHPAWLPAIFLSLMLLLGACASIKLVPAYDEQIDTGLTELYAETSGFVDRMIQSAGTPVGTFEQNQSFYTDSLGKLDALIARAEANRVLNHCPSTKVMGRALDRVALPQEVRGQIGTLPQGDCEVVLFRMIRDDFQDMREIHRLRGARGFPPEARNQFLDGSIGALLRAAMAVQVAKRVE